ncbi:hypothetical protein Y032_0538g3135 [Ancylostoma ceylanicum]|uniref:Uncharacterized protein n=1 Tax=Ancylostoma ceylanicum TaxID=53326 RepID=A0A016WQZ1_9BILA|nr:hypothetical protein Y032_0538g3135 [Ancylostoma ceylanicum]
MDPPELIQKFSIRINNTYAKERSLEDFPEDLQNTLLDFGEDLAGYGADELKSNTLVDLSSSTFFKALGITFEERKARLKELIDERMELREELFKALQRALRDVRSYSYEYYGPDNSRFRWIPNNIINWKLTTTEKSMLQRSRKRSRQRRATKRAKKAKMGSKARGSKKSKKATAPGKKKKTVKDDGELDITIT